MSSLVLILLVNAGAAQAPPNDLCSASEPLCENQITQGTVSGATPGISICFPTDATVYYSFTTNDLGGNVFVVVNRDSVCDDPNSSGDGLEGVVYSATDPCDPATISTVSNCTSGQYSFALSATNLSPNTTYYVQVDAIVNTQGNPTQCGFDITISGPGVSVSAGPDKTIVQGQSVQLDGSGAINYSWSPNNSLMDANTATPTASPSETTTYTVEGERNGCISYDEVTVFIVDPIEAPNAFTPNGDGFNDTWEIDGINRFPNVIVEVYNRWGQRVFSSVGYIQEWNGTRDGNYLPEGTYYWVVQLNDPDIDGDKPITGYVAIIR